jgi:hypothetical protein
MDKGAIVFVGFIVIAFCVISLLSMISEPKKTKDVKEDSNQLKVINNDMIDYIKSQYLKFSKAILLKNEKALQKLCTSSFLKTLNLKNTKAQKILCILSANVINIEKTYVEIEFICRSVSTELIYNRCIFENIGKDFLIMSLGS